MINIQESIKLWKDLKVTKEQAIALYPHLESPINHFWDKKDDDSILDIDWKTSFHESKNIIIELGIFDSL